MRGGISEARSTGFDMSHKHHFLPSGNTISNMHVKYFLFRHGSRVPHRLYMYITYVSCMKYSLWFCWEAQISISLN